VSTVFAQGPRTTQPVPEAAAPPRARLLQRLLGETPSAWLYIAPAVVIIIGLAIVPVFWSALLSLQDKDPIAETTRWVGLAN
jgi:multiple sugar transport system permease protein